MTHLALNFGQTPMQRVGGTGYVQWLDSYDMQPAGREEVQQPGAFSEKQRAANPRKAQREIRPLEPIETTSVGNCCHASFFFPLHSTQSLRQNAGPAEDVLAEAGGGDEGQNELAAARTGTM